MATTAPSLPLLLPSAADADRECGMAGRAVRVCDVEVKEDVVLGALGMLFLGWMVAGLFCLAMQRRCLGIGDEILDAEHLVLQDVIQKISGGLVPHSELRVPRAH